MKTFRIRFQLATGLLIVLAAPPVDAAPLYSGSITGIFSSPMLTGISIDPASNTTSLLDNTLTAIFSGFGTNDIVWGSDNAPPAGTLGSSELEFIGASFIDQPPDQDFTLGTIVYYNGSSSEDSIIFGATFTMSAALVGGGTAMITPYLSPVSLTATINNGTTAVANADFVEFTKLEPTQSFNVLEGASAMAILKGRIVGDPFLDLTGITVPPGSTSGFIGHGLADYPIVPEPTSLVLLSVGLASLAARRLRRR